LDALLHEDRYLSLKIVAHEIELVPVTRLVGMNGLPLVEVGI